MPILLQSLFTSSPPRLNPCLKNPNSFPPIRSRHLNSPFSNSQLLNIRVRRFLNSKAPRHFFHSLPKSYESDSSIATSPDKNPNFNDFGLDYFLSIAEILCFFYSVVVSIVYAVSGWKGVALDGIWRRFTAWGVLGLVGGVAIGAWIRRRQWRRICVETSKGGAGGGKHLNVVERIEKLEQDLSSSTRIIQALSRQLEKLWIRFRVTRKALKQPIAKTAALAQKNSEATRALAAQENILENEIGETQKVLLAMQEQQHKQFELILAIGKSGKLFEDKKEPGKEKVTVVTRNSTKEAKQTEVPQAQPLGTNKGSGNDKA